MNQSDVLVIDDIRRFRFDAVYARTMEEARRLLFEQPWRRVWWDHDMGLTSGSPTTISLANELERMWFEEGVVLPVELMVVHTANPNGRRNLVAALSSIYKVQVVDANDFLAKGQPKMYYIGDDASQGGSALGAATHGSARIGTDTTLP